MNIKEIIDKIMICPICKGEMQTSVINFPIDLKTHFVLIKDVPADVCEQCGEFFIDDDVHIQLEEIDESTKKSNIEFEIIKFAA